MENQTRFNLNSAVEQWRQELAARADLTLETRRELETHLRDTIAGFQRSGLNDEESFWLANRRFGHPARLGEEFDKADPTAIWRERVLWMATAALAFSLWSVSAGFISVYLMKFAFNQSLSDPWVAANSVWNSYVIQLVFGILLRIVPPFVAVAFLFQRGPRTFSWLEKLFQSRARFVMTALGWSILNGGFIVLRSHGPEAAGSLVLVLSYLFSTLSWPLALTIIIAWLMTPQWQKPIKLA